MTNRTVTARDASYAGTIAGIVFTSNGTASTATADDATDSGKRLIAFAKRHGWAVNGGIATAAAYTPDNGKPVGAWTAPECKAYLDAAGVQYPSGTNLAGLRAAVMDGFDVSSQGGSAANLSAGALSGSRPPAEGLPGPTDDAATMALWKQPQAGNTETDVAPTISSQPASASVVAPATHTFSVTAAGTPTPSYQWFRQALGSGPFVAVPGATASTYVTPATVVATNNGDKYHVVCSNSDGSITSADAVLTVTVS